MPLAEVDALLILADIQLTGGEGDTAEGYWVEALSIADLVGYGRRKREIDGLREDLH
jgi:hypothetical protein